MSTKFDISFIKGKTSWLIKGFDFEIKNSTDLSLNVKFCYRDSYGFKYVTMYNSSINKNTKIITIPSIDYHIIKNDIYAIFSIIFEIKGDIEEIKQFNFILYKHPHNEDVCFLIPNKHIFSSLKYFLN